jgi:hypothetical protein
MRISSRTFAVIALAVIGAWGCGGPPEGQVAVHPVSGSVTYQGKPLAGAEVVFEPDQPPPAGLTVPNPSATTDDSGAFKLTTYAPDDGAPAGPYKVKVLTAVGAGSTADRDGILTPRKKKVDVLKGRYADAASSGLTATVQSGTNELAPFELK